MNAVRAAWFCAALVASAVAGCAHSPPPPPAAPAPRAAPKPPRFDWTYTVRVDSELARMNVDMCFPGPPPSEVAPNRSGVRYVERVAWSGSPGTATADPKADAILIEADDPGCLEYEIDFAGMVGERRYPYLRRVGLSVLVSPRTWLMRPPTMKRATAATVRFELPEGVDLSTSWPTVDGSPRGRDATYVVDTTVFRWLNQIVLGTFIPLRVEAAGATFDIAMLDAKMKVSEQGLRAWITDAATAVAMLYDGRFPVDHVQIVGRPVASTTGVVFGRVGRGGGNAVFFRLGQHADDADFVGGWTTTHEFLHLGMPYASDGWMAEGFASYYTEIMRTRKGHRGEDAGWSKLVRAFARGQRDDPSMTLQAASDGLFETAGPQRVYWGGAAIAFLIDVALRRDSGGKVTFDDAMRQLHRCCRFARHSWPAAQLLHKLDQWYGKPLFTEIAAEHLASTEFPPVEAGYEWLGVEVEGRKVAVTPDHPRAVQRADIMAPRR